MTYDDAVRIEERLNEMGLTSDDDKIDYLEHITPDKIDSGLKERGLKSEEDIKDAAARFSDLKSTKEALAQDPNFKSLMESLQRFSESMKELVANIDIEKLGREMFLYRLYEHLHGDVSTYETDIYALAAKWRYTEAQVNRFTAYLEEKGYVKTERVFGEFAIAAVRLTANGVDHVEHNLELGTIGAEPQANGAALSK